MANIKGKMMLPTMRWNRVLSRISISLALSLQTYMLPSEFHGWLLQVCCRLEMVGGFLPQVWTKMMTKMTKSGRPEKLKKQQPSWNRKRHRRTAIFAGKP